MKIRYYVMGIGYAENNFITDYKQSFGDFDTYEEARELFIELMRRDRSSFFENARDIYQLLIQIEEYEEETDFVYVKDEWWLVNPKYKESEI